MALSVRPAKPTDLEALVELRRENAQVHVDLDPARHRVPPPKSVRDYFQSVLNGSQRSIHVLVAEEDGEILGMAELVMTTQPPGTR